MKYIKILKEIQSEISSLYTKGELASYIPALKDVKADDFAMSLTLMDGSYYSVGSDDLSFSIQSISKVFSFTLALETYSKKIYKRLGVEPSGDPFNSLVQLEYENGIPRNPFINAGAIVVMDALISNYKDTDITFNEILSFIQKISNNKNISYDKTIAKSEIQSGYRNLALASLMKSFGNLVYDPKDVLETYFKMCAIKMNTKELSRSVLYLANDGVDPISGHKITSEQRAKRINALMLTCGHYDASGEFAFNVGLPGKSGVGGGIIAVVPDKMGICVYSPKLNKHGNSLIGTKALELFTTKTGFSIF